MAANEMDCARFGDAQDDPGILNGEEALGNHDVEHARSNAMVADGHHQRRRLMAEHPPQRRAISRRWSDRTGVATPGRTPLARLSGVCRSSRAHIIGVKVKDTTAEIRIVMLSVMANSRNSRPTTSPMNSSGISTAISEMVRDRMVKAICSEPLSAACRGESPALDVPGNVFDHHDRIVHDKAGRNGQGHEGQIVEAEAQQIHGAEGADQRQRDRGGGDDRGGQRPQKQKDDHDDQRDCQHQFKLHVAHRPANRRRAVGQHRDLDRGRQGALELRQAAS